MPTIIDLTDYIIALKADIVKKEQHIQMLESQLETIKNPKKQAD
jgi:hypothetical protein